MYMFVWIIIIIIIFHHIYNEYSKGSLFIRCNENEVITVVAINWQYLHTFHLLLWWTSVRLYRSLSHFETSIVNSKNFPRVLFSRN